MAFKYRNYRLWFLGQLCSLAGTWMQNTAQGYMIFELTHDPRYLGAVGFASGISSWLFMLYAGVVADRIPRRTLMIVTQTAMMLLAFVLAALAFAGVVQPWHIIVLAFLLGIANSFDAPARVALVSELVDKEDLSNAIALNGTMFNGATAFGPAIAGLVYAAFGPAWCFTINGLSFIAVIVALALMRFEERRVAHMAARARDALREGFGFVLGEPAVLTVILMVMIYSLTALSFVSLLPDWSVTVLGGDATTNGYLQSARGIGALGGALMIASFGRFKSKGRLFTVGSLLFPALLLLFAQARSVPLALLGLAATGWAFIVTFNMANVLVQTRAPDELRGRVMSVYTLMFFGAMPIGALIAGQIAGALGSPAAVTLGACAALICAIVLWFRAPYVRRLE
jgi:MFS family permease